MALTGATVQASFVPRLIKGVFSRDEFEAMVLKARDATEAEWVGKIGHWSKAAPLGLSPTIQGILKKGGCNPPVGAKAARSLETEISDQHLILVRSPEDPVKKADAWAAAKNPAALPKSIKAAFRNAGWTGTCTDGVKARGVESEFDEFDFYTRGFEDEFEELY